MQSKLKILFNKLNQREKMLMAIIMWTIVIVWMSNTLGSMNDLGSNLRDVGGRLSLQQVKLEMASSIKKQLSVYKDKMGSEKTFSGNELAVTVTNLASRQGLRYSHVRKPKTEENGLLDLHTMTINFRNANIEQLIAFDSMIKEHSPYMVLQYVSISAEKPPLLSADFRIRAFEQREDASF